MKTFQTLFPPLAPRKIALSSARRVVLVAYNAERGTVDWRHYRITVKPYGVSRRVRRALQLGGTSGAGGGATIDLGNERDVADYVLRAHGGPRSSASASGYETAASEVSSAAEDEAEDVVSLAEDYVGRNNRKGQKRAVRLDEIGPRMEIRLVKITEGVPGREGAVIYHEFGTSCGSRNSSGLLNPFFFSVKKTKSEIAAQRASHASKEKLRKERREEQERNVQRKKALAEKPKADAPGATAQVADDEDDEGDDGGGDEEAPWDEDEEVSEGEVSEDDDARSEDRSSDEDEDDPEDEPLRKKTKTKK
jgi:ribosome biogenesis protein SSF1/2